MNDGNMASQVSPISTENDMSKIKAIFDHALNSIVQASELAGEVSKLRGDFDTLKRDMEYLRQRNAELDSLLTDVRGQRDRAMQERDDAKAMLREAQLELGRREELVGKQANELESLHKQLAEVRSDRDQVYTQWDKADKDKSEAEAKLAEIKKALGIVNAPPVDVLKATQTPRVEPERVTITESHDEPLPEPKPVVFQNDPAFDWHKPYHWDDARQCQVQD